VHEDDGEGSLRRRRVIRTRRDELRSGFAAALGAAIGGPRGAVRRRRTGGFSINSPGPPALDIGGRSEARAYNPCMFHSLNAAFNDAAMERATLWLNHVLASEPVAVGRLRPHAGKRMALTLKGWPSVLPAPPVMAYTITPAGLLERSADDSAAAPDLTVQADASNPALAMARTLAGERPDVEVTGDAALAADLSWLFENLRWDYEDDLARVIGPLAAREIARLGGAVGKGLRELVRLFAARGSAAP